MPCPVPLLPLKPKLLHPLFSIRLLDFTPLPQPLSHPGERGEYRGI
ncbi:hypothetical protein MC7420_5770 [Coleofasciculus chthonoplastes PCC 7420]|uniref:Uncharacterized protein n=1 Tax=Coleofasciculus chthonoplastes PCC 7420 TaxID=118168 RepID=B4VVN1_9CYAN|nr:hypothetical protein MC7420_5770 [Coleofasciculus chthonoplastes PCC 7420]